MATPMAVTMRGNDSEKRCLIEATVVTGFESVARTEAIQKIPGSKAQCERGRIFIDVSVSSVCKIFDLCSIDNCCVVMTRFPEVRFSENELEAMGTIRNLVKSVDWEVGLRAWQEIFIFDHPILYQPEEIPEDLGEPQIVSRRPVAKKQKVDQNPAGKRVGESKVKEAIEGGMAPSGNKAMSPGEIVLKPPDAAAAYSSDSVTQDAAAGKVKDKGDKGDIDQQQPSKCAQANELTCKLGTEESAVGEAHDPPTRVRLTTHDPTKLTFRVTCNRTGNNHCFQSMCAAANFGGAIHRYFNWNISMKKFNVEVILNIDGSQVSVCLGLTRESLHRRNIAHFGPTTLKPTIAFNMLRMCKIRPGDVICDPMCGGGTIPIEAAVNWPLAAHVSGEIHNLGVKRTMDNIQELNKKRLAKGKSQALVDAVQWDACAMPLRDSSVDVFISDLPFGKRIGHKVDNWKLYPASMLEMARVCRPETGRACFLTHDKRCMIKTIHGLKKFWRQVRSVGINIGGLSAVVFLVYRTGKTVSPGDTIPTADALRKLPEEQSAEQQPMGEDAND